MDVQFLDNLRRGASINYADMQPNPVPKTVQARTQRPRGGRGRGRVGAARCMQRPPRQLDAAVPGRSGFCPSMQGRLRLAHCASCCHLPALLMTPLLWPVVAWPSRLPCPRPLSPPLPCPVPGRLLQEAYTLLCAISPQVAVLENGIRILQELVQVGLGTGHRVGGLSTKSRQIDRALLRRGMHGAGSTPSRSCRPALESSLSSSSPFLPSAPPFPPRQERRVKSAESENFIGLHNPSLFGEVQVRGSEHLCWREAGRLRRRAPHHPPCRCWLHRCAVMRPWGHCSSKWMAE